MYLDYYGLKEAPFSITPDPRFVFLSERHRDALAHLIYGISQGGGGGFVQLTGEVGTGKTTLSRLLLEQLPERTRVALVLNPRLKPLELLEAICEELGLDNATLHGNGKTLVDALNRHLLEAHAQDIRVVLILDEAQQLSVESLEQVRLLTNLETATHKLLQIVLLGQPELRDILARPELRQLSQRITARYHLMPLDAAETGEYVHHRLAVAGLVHSPFDAGAMNALHRRSDGVPRLINVIAERALLTGYAHDLTEIDAHTVDDAADEILPRMNLRQKRRSWRYGLAAGVLTVAIASAALFLAIRDRDPSPVVTTEAHAVEEPAATNAAEPTVTELLDTGDMTDGAIHTLLRQWQADLRLAERLRDCPFRLDDDALYCVRGRGTFGQLAALDRPVLLLLPHDGSLRPLTLTGLNDHHAEIGLNETTETLPRSALETVWPGEYLAILRLPESVPPVVTGPLPEWAMSALGRFEANRSLPALSDRRERIERMQLTHGLRPDGITGPDTWWVLSAYLDEGPRLRKSATTAATR